MPPPRTIAELKSVLGSAAYYQRFIEGYTDVIRPLRKLENTYKTALTEIKGVWSDECEQSFHCLKTALAKAPILAHPDFEALPPSNRYPVAEP